MNRRNFLKFVGLGAVATIPTIEIKKEETLREKVTKHVIYPEDIVKGKPESFEKLDLNDGITGMAGLFTAQICEKWIMSKENQTMENLKAMMRFSITQYSFVGLIVARQCVRVIIEGMSGPEKIAAVETKELQDVIKHFGDFLVADCYGEYSDYIYRLENKDQYRNLLGQINRA